MPCSRVLCTPVRKSQHHCLEESPASQVSTDPSKNFLMAPTPANPAGMSNWETLSIWSWSSNPIPSRMLLWPPPYNVRISQPTPFPPYTPERIASTTDRLESAVQMYKSMSNNKENVSQNSWKLPHKTVICYYDQVLINKSTNYLQCLIFVLETRKRPEFGIKVARKWLEFSILTNPNFWNGNR